MTVAADDRSAPSGYRVTREDGMFFPLDSLAEVQGVYEALGGHVAEAWSGGTPSESLGLLPCPSPTHAEPVVVRTAPNGHGGEKSARIPGWWVWHGCAVVFVPIADLETSGDGEIDLAGRFPRLLSAICNWLYDLHRLDDHEDGHD